MIINNLDNLSHYLLEQAVSVNFDLQGPAETEYGFGWDPTITFWSGHRRVHFYFEHLNGDGITIRIPDGVTVEVAEIQLGLKVKRGAIETDSLVKRTIIKTIGEAWNIIDCFLRQHCEFTNLPSHNWVVDTLDHDKFIPHPPSGAHNA